MRIFLSIACIFWLAGSVISRPAVNTGEIADSNNAFYAGETRDYILKAPAHFRMISDEAKTDGYSFAFIPDTSSYVTAPIVIGVNIYKVRGLSFENVLANDTNSIREHFGPELEIRRLDSVFSGSGDELTAFYLDNKKQFIPNVMTAYYFGSTELLILELSIAPTAVRPKAEAAFMNCLENFTATKRGQLGAK
jgi:hypothetical protein